MIIGEYVFYENGKEIARSKNLITQYGKRFITSVLAGANTYNTKDIAFGIDSTAAAESNTRLGFEFYRVPVSLGSIDIDTTEDPTLYSAIYKTTIPQDVSGIIKEIGLYPGTRTSINTFDSKFISDFESYLNWYNEAGDAPAYIETSDARIGNGRLEFKFETLDTTSTNREYKYNIGQFDLSGYSASDSLSLAYNRSSSNLSSITVKLYSSSSNYFYGVFTPSSGTGDKINEVSLSDIFSNTVGSPDAASISTIGIELNRTSASSSATAYMDGLRINDQDTFDPGFGLISRSVLATPITKISGRSVDVEYKLSLDF
jgi:hypothetical protein